MENLRKRTLFAKSRAIRQENRWNYSILCIVSKTYLLSRCWSWSITFNNDKYFEKSWLNRSNIAYIILANKVKLTLTLKIHWSSDGHVTLKKGWRTCSLCIYTKGRDSIYCLDRILLVHFPKKCLASDIALQLILQIGISVSSIKIFCKTSPKKHLSEWFPCTRNCQSIIHLCLWKWFSTRGKGTYR